MTKKSRGASPLINEVHRPFRFGRTAHALSVMGCRVGQAILEVAVGGKPFRALWLSPKGNVEIIVRRAKLKKPKATVVEIDGVSL